MRESSTVNFIALCAGLATSANQTNSTKPLCSRHGIFVVALSIVALFGCASPAPPVAKEVYDFGPSAKAAAPHGQAKRSVIALPDVQAHGSLESPALLYRLQYSDAHQLRPYSQARWSVPPAQLVRVRLRDALATRAVTVHGEGSARHSLLIELDEFSHVFESPQRSFGLVRLQASLLQGDQIAQQASFVARVEAPSQNAAGGVRALTDATDSAINQLLQWLQPHLP